MTLELSCVALLMATARHCHVSDVAVVLLFFVPWRWISGLFTSASEKHYRELCCCFRGPCLLLLYNGQTLIQVKLFFFFFNRSRRFTRVAVILFACECAFCFTGSERLNTQCSFSIRLYFGDRHLASGLPQSKTEKKGVSSCNEQSSYMSFYLCLLSSNMLPSLNHNAEMLGFLIRFR